VYLFAFAHISAASKKLLMQKMLAESTNDIDMTALIEIEVDPRDLNDYT
jgi:hypothetical protein